MEVRKATEREKEQYPNAEFAIELNTRTQYFTKRAIIELYGKIKNVLK